MEESDIIIAQQNKQLTQQTKLAALGTMAAGIAHEINNPLTVIRGYGGQIERMVTRGKLTDEALVNVSRQIVKTSDRISAIVRGLRVFSRDGSKDPLKRESVSAIIEDAKTFCFEKLTKHGVELRVVLPESDFDFDCRMVEVGQVIINLVGNAIDAISGQNGAWVELKFTLIHEAKSVRISVSDSGPLINDDVAKSLFTPFFTTKPVGEGTGLGLAICLGIAKSHSGNLFLDRSHGHNEFVMEIPRFAGDNIMTRSEGAA